MYRPRIVATVVGGGCGAVEMATFSNYSMLQLATRGDMGDPTAAPCVCWSYIPPKSEATHVTPVCDQGP